MPASLTPEYRAGCRAGPEYCRAARRTLRRTIAALSMALSTVVVFQPAQAATEAHPARNHIWQRATIAGRTGAIALPCPDCAPDLSITCPRPRRGILRLVFHGASVANGKEGAGKTILLSFGEERLRRRAVTLATQRGFTPVLEIATDDALVARMAAGGAVEAKFYGQRSFIGLDGAQGPISDLVTVCLPEASPMRARHCLWSIILACSPSRAAAQRAGRNFAGAIVRKSGAGYCAMIVSGDLAGARARARALGGELQRSCLP